MESAEHDPVEAYQQMAAWPDHQAETGKWRMPLSRLVEELMAPGFTLERLVEPIADEAIREVDPAAWEKLAHRPAFLMALLRRP